MFSLLVSFAYVGHIDLACKFLLPVGGAMTVCQYCYADLLICTTQCSGLNKRIQTQLIILMIITSIGMDLQFVHNFVFVYFM